jgi:hypothetical protein
MGLTTRVIARRNEPAPGVDHTAVEAAKPLLYEELEIRSRRVDPKHVDVWVHASPTGAKTKRIRVEAVENLGDGLHLPADVDWWRAADVGRLLADIVFPPPIYRIVQEAIRALDQHSGLRVRLALDPSLIDLPWEYTYRPELRGEVLQAGFVFLDERLSLVRGAVARGRGLEPSDEPQQLLFLGAFWPGGDDRWEVRSEYERLAMATRPVGEFVSMRFLDIVDTRAVDAELADGAAIVHYAGHCDLAGARGYLVREANADDRGIRLFSDEFASGLRAAKTRLLVLNACNSGRWPVVEPLLRSGVAAIIGIRGVVSNVSAIAFCEVLYAALSVGLSVDEAVTFARQRLLLEAPSGYPCEWGSFMVYMPTRESVPFPRRATRAVRAQQTALRKERTAQAAEVRDRVALPGDGAATGQLISELAQRGVLILGRFSAQRKPILEAVRDHLERSQREYLPILFDFDQPAERDLTEAVLGFAGLSRFIIVDLTDPRGVPAELQQIVPSLPSVPVKPLLQEGWEPYANVENILRRENALPIFVYEDVGDLLASFDRQVVEPAERKLAALRRRYAATRRELAALRQRATAAGRKRR